MTILGPICKSNLTNKVLIQADSSRNSVTVAHFIHVLLHDSIVNIDKLPNWTIFNVRTQNFVSTLDQWASFITKTIFATTELWLDWQRSTTKRQNIQSQKWIHTKNHKTAICFSK